MLSGGGKPEQRFLGHREQRFREGSEGTPDRENFHWVSGGEKAGQRGGQGQVPRFCRLCGSGVRGRVSLEKSGQGRDTVGLKGGGGALCLQPPPGKEGPRFSFWGLRRHWVRAVATEKVLRTRMCRTPTRTTAAQTLRPVEAWAPQRSCCSPCKAQ